MGEKTYREKMFEKAKAEGETPIEFKSKAFAKVTILNPSKMDAAIARYFNSFSDQTGIIVEP